MAPSEIRCAVLFGTSALAVLGYVFVSEGVRRKKTAKADRKVRSKGRAKPVEKPVANVAARASGPLGKWYGHLPAALGTAWRFRRRGRSAAAFAVVGTSLGAIVSGYALVREGLASPIVALPLSATALASGVGRLALDRHWASDLLGGYCAGIAFGTACAAIYEWRRGLG